MVADIRGQHEEDELEDCKNRLIGALSLCEGETLTAQVAREIYITVFGTSDVDAKLGPEGPTVRRIVGL